MAETVVAPSIFAKWGGLLFIGGFFGIVFWKLASGGIVLDQLFEGDVRDQDPKNVESYSTYVSVGRVQSFLVSVFVASYYLLQTIQNPTEFPRLPGVLIAALAGSQVLYLGGKVQAMFFGRFRNSLR